MKGSSTKYTLKRYTSLPSLLHLLYERQLTLLSPATWDDRNDRYFMREYKEKGDYKSVLALCFTHAPETYHHWRVFTHGADGVCISFDQDALIERFENEAGIRLDYVDYKKITDIKGFTPNIRDLPFLKRQPYADEKEFRIVYCSREREMDSKTFALSLSCIDRITLSPWMHKALANAVKATIKCIDGCSRLKVYQTTLLENEQWKQVASRSS